MDGRRRAHPDAQKRVIDATSREKKRASELSRKPVPRSDCFVVGRSKSRTTWRTRLVHRMRMLHVMPG